MVNKDPIISNKRTGTQANPYQKINEPLIIDNSGIVQLTEYPERYNRVVVTGENKDWYETDSDIPDANSFKVDYEHKTISFHITNIGRQLNFEYLGMGNSYFPASSIYVERDGLSVVETLDTLTDTTVQARDEVIKTNKEVQDAEVIRIDNEQVRESEHTQAMDDVGEAIETTNALIRDTGYIEPFNVETNYIKNNVVSFNGHSFMAKQNTVGNNPPDPLESNENAYWGLVARKGADGNGTVKTPVDTFIATEGQRVFNLSYTYDQFQGRTNVTVGGVPQFTPEHYEETSSTSITLNEGVPEGTVVKAKYFSESVPLQSDIQTTVDNHTNAISQMQQKVGDGFVRLGKVKMVWNDITQSLDFTIEE